LKKLLTSCVFGPLLVSAALAQPEIALWRLYDAGGIVMEHFEDLFLLDDDGYYVCGTNQRPWLIRLDERGELRWSYVDNEQFGVFASVIESDNGDAVVGGRIFANEHRFVGARFTEEGEQIWFSDFGVGFCSAVIELKDGRLVLAGAFGPMASSRACLICVDADGEVQWTFSYGDRVLRSRFFTIRETEGGIVAAGRVTPTIEDPTKGLIVKVGFDGRPVWQMENEGEGENRHREYYSMVSIPNGGFAIAGLIGIRVLEGNIVRSYSVGGIIVVNERGNEVSTMNWGRYIELNGLAKFSDGHLAVGGSLGTENGVFPLVFILDANLQIRWNFSFQQLVRGQSPRPQDDRNRILSLIVDDLDRVVAAGGVWNPEFDRGMDGLITRLSPDVIGPIVMRWSPHDTTLTTLPGDSIQFILRAVNQQGQEAEYQWLRGDTLKGRDTTETFRFESLGEETITCRFSDDEATRQIRWHVEITDLFIHSHTPDTLSLTLQRNSEIDFSLDSVAYIGDLENLRYEWMLYDSAAVRWEEVAGDDRIGIRSYAFDRTGGYALKAKVFDPNVDPVPADSVQWAIQVRGVIRAYEPNLPEISLEPRQETTFELIPFNANNDSIEFWWTLDEADTLSTQSTLSISFEDTGRYVVSGYAREQVGEEEWEEDVQRWAVNVGMLNAEFGMRNEGDLEIEDISLQIAPNPFNDQAMVMIDLGGQAFLPALRADKNARPPRAQMGGLFPVRLSLYALDGREVLRLHDGQLSPGSHTFSLSDFQTFSLPSGIYFLLLQTGSHSRTVKAVLMR